MRDEIKKHRLRDRRRTFRRRRVGALVVIVSVSIFLYFAAGATARPEPHSYTVEPGDTLWGIATENSSTLEDPRLKVEEIRSENHLESYEIHPGEVLVVSR